MKHMETSFQTGQAGQPNQGASISELRASGREIVAGDEHSIRTRGEWLSRGIARGLRSAPKTCRQWAKDNGRCCFSVSPNGETWRYDPNGTRRKIKQPYFVSVGA